MEDTVRGLLLIAQGSDSAYELAARKLAAQAINEVGHAGCANARKALVRDLAYWSGCGRAKSQERESLIAEIQTALDAILLDTAEAALEHATKTVVARHVSALTAREAADRKKRQAWEIVNAGLSCQESVQGEYEWDSYSERVCAREQLRLALEGALTEAAEDGEFESAGVRKRIEFWVDGEFMNDEDIYVR